MIDSLYSFEAEENVLGFFFNNHIEEDKRKQILQLVHPELFQSDKYKTIIKYLKLYQIFDRIILWDRIQKLKTKDTLQLEWSDFENIDTLVLEEDVNSYVEILIDRYQKRKLYYFGEMLKEAMLNGEDQFGMALKAQELLSTIPSKKSLPSNEELLDSVLNEKPSDIISTGYQALDEYLGGYSRGMIITIAGDSGHLKTTLALDKAFRMVENNPTLKVGIFSKEMTAEALVKKQISRICEIPINLIFSQKYDREFVKQKMMALEPWRNNRIRIIDPNRFTGTSDIAKIQMTYGFDIWFLDFIQLLEFAKTASGMSDYNIQVAQNMRNLQSLALATKSVGIILSQVRKGVETRPIKKPTISDIEWSGLIKQLSAYVFFSYYPGKYYGFSASPSDHYFLLGEKTRFAETFTYPMKVNPELGIFTEITSPKERLKMTNDLDNILGISRYSKISNKESKVEDEIPRRKRTR